MKGGPRLAEITAIYHSWPLLVPLIMMLCGFFGCATGPDCIPDERTSFVEIDEMALGSRFAPAYCAHPDNQDGLLVCLYFHKFNCYAGERYSATVCIESDSATQLRVDSLLVRGKGLPGPKRLLSRRGRRDPGVFQWHQLDGMRLSSRQDSIVTVLHLSLMDSLGGVTPLAAIERSLFKITDRITGVERFYTGHLRPRSEIDSL